MSEEKMEKLRVACVSDLLRSMTKRELATVRKAVGLLLLCADKRGLDPAKLAKVWVVLDAMQQGSSKKKQEFSVN
jgi:hypothetical protein